MSNTSLFSSPSEKRISITTTTTQVQITEQSPLLAIQQNSPKSYFTSSSRSYTSSSPSAFTASPTGLKPFAFTSMPLISPYSPEIRGHVGQSKSAASNRRILRIPNLQSDLPASGMSSAIQSAWNSINVLVGVGLLSVPFAMKLSGWFGMILLIFLGLVCCYTGKLLGRCLASRPNLRSLPDIAEAAFGPRVKTAVTLIFFLELFFAGCAAYLVLEGDNLNKLFPAYPPAYFIILIACVVTPSCWLENLSSLSYLSVCGIAGSLFLLLVIMWETVAQDKIRNPSDTELIRLSSLPISIGLLQIGYSGHAILPSIYSEMRVKANFDRMLNFSFFFTILVYVLMASAGYLLFGSLSLKEITLNLGNDPISKACIIAIIINPISKFALTLNPIACAAENSLFGLRSAAEELDSANKIKKNNRKLRSNKQQQIESIESATEEEEIDRLNLDENSNSNSFLSWLSSSFTARQRRKCLRLVFRTFLCALILLTALYMPYFDLILEFCGSAFSFLISLVFPSAAYLKLCWKKIGFFEFWINIFIIAFGLVAGMIGSYYAIMQMGQPDTAMGL